MSIEKLTGSLDGYYRACFNGYAAYGLTEEEAKADLEKLIRRIQK